MFFTKISNTWEAMGASFNVLKQEKKLLVFPLCSMIACLLVLASFAVPMIMADAWMPPDFNADPTGAGIYYGVLFLFYLANYFIITFFNAAVIGAAVRHLRGKKVTLSIALKTATIRLPQIFGWSLVAATVGLILRAIEDQSEWVGQFVSALLGAVWTMTTFLVVPVLVVEGMGPIDAFKRSASMLKKTWGEQMISNFGFGIIFFLLAIPGIVLIGIGIVAASTAMTILMITLGVLYLIVLSLVQATLQGIFQAVLYVYARKGGEAPRGFDDHMLQNAMTSKR